MGNIMREPLSVNEALDELLELEHSDVHVQGILHFEFEDVALYHHPKAERKEGYDSSIWIEVGMGSLGFNTETCNRLNGQLVSVHGTLFGPSPSSGGCGHGSLWPAAVLARTLERV